MYRALYRKYRPARFADVVGQEHVVTTLREQVASGKVSHAYLFTGPRGTGKTSCAKILATAANCENPVDGDACLSCPACERALAGDNFDITEIDAASNNGVENIRSLREQVNYAPAGFKYRVFIIDEVHMLSTGAFNALLKTLEEPPQSVIFILATTEVQRLPATIISRCQRFDFKRIEPGLIAKRLLYVAEQEGLTLTEGAASLIAALSDGGMRDALSTLDLCASEPEITEKTVEEVTGTAENERLERLAGYLAEGDTAAAFALSDELYRGAADLQYITGQMVSLYRDLMVILSVPDARGLVRCGDERYERLKGLAARHIVERVIMSLRRFSDALDRMNSQNRRAEFEMALLDVANPAVAPLPENILSRLSALERGRGRDYAGAESGGSPASGGPSPNDGPPPNGGSSVTEVTSASGVSPASGGSPFSGESSASGKSFANGNSSANEGLSANGGSLLNGNSSESDGSGTAPEVGAAAGTGEPVSAGNGSVGENAFAGAASPARGAPAGAARGAVPSPEECVPVENWDGVVKELSEKSPLLATFLKGSSAYIGGEYLLIDCEQPDFFGLIRQPAQRSALRAAAEKVLGKRYNLGPYKRQKPEPEADGLDEIERRLREFDVKGE